MTTFTTDCTLPDGLVNYVTSPNTRGTLQILWSSLTAILLCTWTTQHLNVPQQSSPKTCLQIWTRRVHRFVDRLKWLFINLLTPEFLIGKAFCDRVSAEQHSRVYKATAEEDGVLWGRSHCFFANMGGFVLDFDTRSESSSRLTISATSRMTRLYITQILYSGHSLFSFVRIVSACFEFFPQAMGKLAIASFRTLLTHYCIYLRECCEMARIPRFPVSSMVLMFTRKE